MSGRAKGGPEVRHDASPAQLKSATRPWVDAFADEMEKRLAANRHKGDREGWVKLRPPVLMELLTKEHDELWAEIQADPHYNRARVLHECADVANFAMMIADVVGGLQPKVKP